jgi:hypothetical protein
MGCLNKGNASMWLSTKLGFFSVIESEETKDTDAPTYRVRSTDALDIEALRKAVFPHLKIDPLTTWMRSGLEVEKIQFIELLALYHAHKLAELYPHVLEQGPVTPGCAFHLRQQNLLRAQLADPARIADAEIELLLARQRAPVHLGAIILDPFGSEILARCPSPASMEHSRWVFPIPMDFRRAYSKNAIRILEKQTGYTLRLATHRQSWHHGSNFTHSTTEPNFWLLMEVEESVRSVTVAREPCQWIHFETLLELCDSSPAYAAKEFDKKVFMSMWEFLSEICRSMHWLTP